MAATVDRITRRMLALIVDGVWPVGLRIPPERAIALRFETSRPTVRSAIARLIEWRVIVTRQGSGATVLERRRWKGDVLALVFAHLLGNESYDELVPLTADAFAMRRSIVCDVVARACGRVGPGDLDAARAVCREAWAARDDMLRFSATEREVLPQILDAAGMFASVWILNSLMGPYLGVIEGVAARASVPQSYLELNLKMLDAIEANDRPTATATLDEFLNALDSRMIASLPPELREKLASYNGEQT